MNLVYFYWQCYLLAKHNPGLDRAAIERLAEEKVNATAGILQS